MGLRNRQTAYATPQPQMGVSGAAKITTNGTIITAIEKYGCISGVTLFGAAQFQVALWPPQPYYTVGSCCTFVSSATLCNLSVTAATLTPSTFQIQPVVITPVAGIVPPVLWVTVFGPIVKPVIRSTNGQPVEGLAKGPLDVIGIASYSLNTGAVTNLRTWGAIKNVRFVSTSIVDVDVWPAQRFYTIVGSCSSDGSNASAMFFPNTPGQTANGFRAQSVGIFPATIRNPQLNNLTIFGFRTPLMNEATKGLPKGRLGVLALSKTSSTGSSTVGPFRAMGNFQNVIPVVGNVITMGIQPALITSYPAKQFQGTGFGCYSFMSHPSSDLVNPSFAGWNASLAGGGTAVALSLGSAGLSPAGARTCQVWMTTLFGTIAA